jgi:RNA polymerase sigma-70 factor (ECF subfamily)
MVGDVVPLRRAPTEPGVLPDEALIGACARGDEAALAALFDRHREMVHRFLDRMVGAPPDVLEDLLQSTFVEVWRCAGRFRGRSKVTTWIIGIAHNMARHHLRDTIRRRAAIDTLLHRPPPRVATPEEETAGHERVQRLRLALAALPEKMRAAFILTEIEELSGKDAAQALGIRPNALWRRVFEAKKRLRRALEEER